MQFLFAQTYKWIGYLEYQLRFKLLKAHIISWPVIFNKLYNIFLVLINNDYNIEDTSVIYLVPPIYVFKWHNCLATYIAISLFGTFLLTWNVSTTWELLSLVLIEILEWWFPCTVLIISHSLLILIWYQSQTHQSFLILDIVSYYFIYFSCLILRGQGVLSSDTLIENIYYDLLI